MPRHIHPTPLVVRPPADLLRREPGLRRASHALGLKYASNQVVMEEELQAIGAGLWQALDLHEGFDTAAQAAGAAILPVIVESDVADVQALPWETLYHPSYGFIGKHPGFTLTRRVSAPPQSPSSLRKGPLRVLLFTSLPDDVDPERGRLNVEEEQVQVQEALLPWIANGLVQLEMPDDGRFSTLQVLLRDFQPHLLFLSGHGSYHHQPHTGEAPYGEFLFESETGMSDRVREDAIVTALIGQYLRQIR